MSGKRTRFSLHTAVICLTMWVVLLLPADAYAVPPNDKTLLKLIDRQDIKGIRAAVREGISLDRKIRSDSASFSPLQYAILRVRPRSVQTLIDAGADLEFHGPSGWPPLFYAVLMCTIDGTNYRWYDREKAVEILDILIAGGADVNAINSQGEYPLSMAFPGQVDAYAYETAKRLIAAGANVNPALNGSGLPPLFWAVSLPMIPRKKLPEYDRAKLVKLLLDAGADPHVRLPDGQSILHCETIDPASAMLLLEAGLNSDLRDQKGKTPFDRMIECNNYEVALLLRRYARSRDLDEANGI